MANNGLQWGPLNSQSKLRESQVREILARKAAGEMTADLAKEFGMSKKHVQKIVAGKQWRHLHR
jgi:hypothetical protein